MCVGSSEQRPSPAANQMPQGNFETLQAGLQRPEPQIGFPGHTLQSLALQSNLPQAAGKKVGRKSLSVSDLMQAFKAQSTGAESLPNSIKP